jgi:hypothetical protein
MKPFARAEAYAHVALGVFSGMDSTILTMTRN